MLTMRCDICGREDSDDIGVWISDGQVLCEPCLDLWYSQLEVKRKRRGAPRVAQQRGPRPTH